MRSLFTNLDADDSGYISLVELEENMHKKEVRASFVWVVLPDDNFVSCCSGVH